MAAKEFVNFEELREALSIEAVAKYLGLRLTDRDQAKADCPVCESANALAVNKTKGRFYCHKAETGGDAIALTAHVRGIRQLDAAKLLMRDLLGNSADKRPPRNGQHGVSRRAERQEDRIGTKIGTKVEAKMGDKTAMSGLTPLDYLEHDHEAVEALGLSPEDAEALGIGHANKGMMRGLVAIPIRLEDGSLAGYIGIEQAKLPTRWHGIATNIVPLHQKKRA